ncbi:MAG: hypothetical protein ACR2P0_05690 [Acidimicrobiales bacterium]
MDSADLYEPSLIRAMWRHKYIVVACVATVLVIGLSIARTRPEQFEANAGLAVRDPGLTDLFQSTRTISPERYVVDQVEILQSDVVAAGAAILAADADPPVDLLAVITDNPIRIDFNDESDFVRIIARAQDATTAQTLANSIALSYQEVAQDEADTTRLRLVEQLDVAIADVDDELEQLREQTSQVLDDELAGTRLDDQVTALVDQLVALRAEAINPSEADLTEVEFINQELQALRIIQELQNAAPEIAQLLQLQKEATDVRAALRLRRAEVDATAARAGSGVTLFSPARPGRSQGISPLLAIAASGMLGLVIAAGISYYLSLRTLEFTHQDQPEPVLSAPLLGALPNFGRAGADTSLVPARDDPSSASAEAVRFVTAAITSVQRSRRNKKTTNSLRNLGSVAFISADQGDGKSIAVTNVAIAAAFQGWQVLVIDADFGQQSVSEMLVPSRTPGPGITELAAGTVSMKSATRRVMLDGSPSLDLLTRGRLPVTGPDFFSAPETYEVLRRLSDQYELVLIDTPALLGVAYSSSLIRHVGRVIGIVPHGGKVASASAMRQRLDLNGVELMGYAYNRGPYNMGRGSDGSLHDVLGSIQHALGTGD